MSTAIQFRRGTTVEHAVFTGAAGEVTVDTDKDALVVHDGLTAGGFPTAKEAAIGARKAATVGGTVDAITATFSPAFASLAAAAGYVLAIPLAGANTIAGVTIAIDGLAAKPAIKGSDTALAVGDIPGADFVGLFVYDASLDKFQMLNPYSSVSVGYTGQFKNKIIGGDFTTNPWQRGTSFTALASNSYGADRWRVTHSSTAVVDMLKTADAPTASEAGIFTQHCLHLDVTTADAAIAAGDFYVVRQRIEGYNAAPFGFGQAGTRYVTLHFWHKHTKTGTYCVSLINSAADRSYVAEYTQAVSDTWEEATVTVAVDTAGTWLYDNGIGLDVRFALAGGATYQTAAGAWAAGNFYTTANQVNALDNVANNFKIALVQLEAGQTATDFETRSVGQELELCLRYLPAFNYDDGGSVVGPGQCYSTNDALINIPFQVPARIAPTGVTVSNVAHFIAYNAATSSAGAPAAIAFQSNTSKYMGFLDCTDFANNNLVAGNFTNLIANNAAAQILFTGCEL